MPISLQPYQPEHLARVLAFVGKCLRDADLRALHPGDIAHWMSNTYLGEGLDQRFALVKGADGDIAAFVSLPAPREKAFDVLLPPALYGSDFEREVILACEAMTRERLLSASKNADVLTTGVYTGDSRRADLLLSIGYRLSDDPADMLSRRSPGDPIPSVSLPNGFAIRPSLGEGEVDTLIAVQHGAFGRAWTADDYLKTIRTPGFDPQRELVVTAPDGRLAAFTVIWFDPISRSGLFEPVGCHPDFQPA
jgi:hypothetical protein